MGQELLNQLNADYQRWYTRIRSQEKTGQFQRTTPQLTKYHTSKNSWIQTMNLLPDIEINNQNYYEHSPRHDNRSMLRSVWGILNV